MFLIQRNIDLEVSKTPLWIDDTPVRPKPSPLLLSLLSRAAKSETMGIPYPTLEHPPWPT